MTIFFPVFYVCVALQCQFIQATTYDLDEKTCQAEVDSKVKLSNEKQRIVGICADMTIKFKDEQDADKLSRSIKKSA